jgi:hypothetical protein
MSATLARLPLRTLFAVAGLSALGAACAPKQQAAAPGPRIYAVDVQGRSALCDVPQKVSLAAGRPTEAAMTLDNDGGWCGIATDRAGPGLVTAKPANGRLHVRKVGATTRVDYIPDRGFVGTDTFAVKLLPDQAELKVAATVQGSATQQQATAAPAPAPTPTPAPAKRAPAARKAAPAKR